MLVVSFVFEDYNKDQLKNKEEDLSFLVHSTNFRVEKIVEYANVWSSRCLRLPQVYYSF